jgi:hypothetical protein
VNSGHELRWHQPSFASGGDYLELVEDFAGHADAAMMLPWPKKS